MGKSDKHDRERVINHECHAQGLIWVGDTSQPGSLKRLQHEFDLIGNIMPEFEVTGFENFDHYQLNWYGYPEAFVLYQHMWKEDGEGRDTGSETRVQRGSMNDVAFDQTVLRTKVPVNWHCTSDLCLRYQKDGDRITPDWESAHQYFSVMHLAELEREHMLTDDDRLREESVVALVEHRSGLVLPLPAHSVISWMHYNDGAGVEFAVYDGKSLQWQMDTYPEYFDPDMFLNEDDVELDIANCLDLIERIHTGFLNPRSLTKESLPTCPAHERVLKERKR